MELNILVLPGDGIGAEVTGEAARVLRHVADKWGHRLNVREGLLGGVAIHKKGTPVPSRAAWLWSIDAYHKPTSRPRSSTIFLIMYDPQRPVAALATNFTWVAPAGLGKVITMSLCKLPLASGTAGGSQIRRSVARSQGSRSCPAASCAESGACGAARVCSLPRTSAATRVPAAWSTTQSSVRFVNCVS